jgi:hypothetical protein
MIIRNVSLNVKPFVVAPGCHRQGGVIACNVEERAEYSFA